VRLFIAIEIDEQARRRLAEASRRLRYLNAKITWVAVENFHFTLKFLGETEESKLESIQQAMQSVASAFEPIRCRLQGLGQFPRVIWAGIHGETEQLSALAARLDSELGSLGFATETRPFKSHLTLGRIKFVGDKEGLTRLLDSSKNEGFGDVRVENIHLFRSQLTPRGSIYTKLFTASLKGADHGHQN
jgi:2'-5' RNA ligase